jgi:adenylosuccinate synthase
VCGGVDALALTHLDRFDTVVEKRKIAVAYQTANTEKFTELPLKSEKTDLRSQEVLTRILKSVTAVYESVQSQCTPEEYIRQVGEKLKVPVTIGSYGPSATDKRLISA